MASPTQEAVAAEHMAEQHMAREALAEVDMVEAQPTMMLMDWLILAVEVEVLD